MTEERSGNSSLIVFAVGAALGAAAAILFTPRSGRESRRRLFRVLDRLEGEGKEWVDRGLEILERTQEPVGDKARTVRRTVEKAARKWGD